MSTVAKILLGALFPFLMIMTACGASESDYDEPTPPREATVEKAKNFTKLQLEYGQRDAYKFTMDGTECIMATNEQAVALSCDWSKK